MSSDKAHGPIYIPGPFIPTIAPQNSTLLLLEKKGDFDIPKITLLCSYVTSFFIGVFSITQKHALDISAFGIRLHLIFMATCSLRSMV